MGRGVGSEGAGRAEVFREKSGLKAFASIRAGELIGFVRKGPGEKLPFVYWESLENQEEKIQF